MMSFGKRLRLLRKEKELTQKGLGEKMGITEQAISHYEKDKRNPDTEMVKKIAKHFNVSVDYLLGESKESAPADKIILKDKETEMEIKELMERFNVHLDGETLTKEDKESVIDLLRMLRDRDKKKT